MAEFKLGHHVSPPALSVALPDQHESAGPVDSVGPNTTWELPPPSPHKIVGLYFLSVPDQEINWEGRGIPESLPG